ncbi:MAG: methyltransferase [Myxococcales bacterium]|nr:methyltransferase [Myxococcales bacterium]
MGDISNRLGRTRSEEGDHWVFRFANGLVVHTEPFMKPDRQRILPLGGPQDTILNRLVCVSETVKGRRVFEPFAGSGILGLMALRLGAGHVDFLDINPRACEFQRDNAWRNGFAADRFVAHLGSIEDFEPEAPFDLVLANPPFVPTPPGVEGTLTSAAGADGNELVDVLLQRMGTLLEPDGEAFIYTMQLLANGTPLLAPRLQELLDGRTTHLTPAQAEPMPFDDYYEAYRRSFPAHHDAIEAWRGELEQAHGDNLALQHYVMHVSARRDGPALWTITDDLKAKYGMLPYPAGANRELALARVMENVVLG